MQIMAHPRTTDQGLWPSEFSYHVLAIGMPTGRAMLYSSQASVFSAPPLPLHSSYWKTILLP